MSDPVRTVIDALEAAGLDPKPNGRGWKSRCPGHDDHLPSLDIDRGDDGRALLICRSAGCTCEQIVRPIGLKVSDLFAGSTNGQATKRIVATFPYVDSTGELLYEAVKYQPKDFRFRRPDGNGGWIWNLKDTRRILYRLPDLAGDPTTAYVTEGEKDGDRLAREGLTATCCPGGAGKWKHLDDDSALEGHRVVILPDHDDVGHRHAEDVASRLQGRVREVRVLELPDLPEGGDVSDWLDAGHDADDLRRLAEAAPVWQPGPEPFPPAYRTAAESRKAIDAMAETSRGLQTGALRLCDQVAEWFARKGADVLQPELEARFTPNPDRPFLKPSAVGLAAAASGVSRSHFHRLGQIGRVRRLLRARNTDDLSDRTLGPLVKLLPDRAETVPEALESARHMAKSERKRLGSRHTRAIVAEIVPEPKCCAARNTLKGSRARSNSMQLQDQAPVETLCHQILECFEGAAMIQGVPQRLWEVLQEADHLSRGWLKKTHSLTQ